MSAYSLTIRPPTLPPPPAGYIDPTEFGESVTVAQLVEYWRKTKRDKMKPRSYQETGRILDLFVAAFGQYPAMKLRPYHAIAWIKTCRKSWGNGMQHKVSQALLALFNHAEAFGVIDKNPVKGIRKEFSAGPRRPEATAEQFQNMIRHCSDQFLRRLVIFVGWTGCRSGEASTTRWADVDWENRVVVLQDHKTVKKTKEPRKIPLMAPAYKLLRWMYERAEDREGVAFTNSTGRRWTAQSLSLRMSRLQWRAGVPRGITLHCLRHRWITSLIARGVPVKIAGEAAGHKSFKTTERYCHLDQRTDVVIDWLDRAQGTGDDDIPIPPPVDQSEARHFPRPKPAVLRTRKSERLIAKCRDAIRALLANGKMPSKDLLAELQRQGHSWHSIQQAKVREALVYNRSKFGGPTYADLPPAAKELSPDFGG
jgi:integrase